MFGALFHSIIASGTTGGGGGGGGGGGSSFPTLSITSPQWTTTAQKSGSGALLGGSSAGTATITLVPNDNGSGQSSFSCGFWFKSSDTGNWTGPAGHLVTFGANLIGIGKDGSGDGNVYGIINDTSLGSFSLRDAAWHWCVLRYEERNGYVYGGFFVDGTQVRAWNDVGPQLFGVGATTFTIDASILNTGDVIDDIVISNNATYPALTGASGEAVADVNTNVIWHLNSNGTGTGYTAPAGSAGNGTARLLDTLTVTPAMAFSTRRLRDLYTGSAIRVRRDLDNAEADIGFNGADLDTAALLSFVGSGTGYVTKMYNQAAGATTNFFQTDATKQPIICASGATNLFKTGGKAAPLYGDTSVMTGLVTLGTTDNIGVSGVSNVTGTTGGDSRPISYMATGASTDWNDAGSFDMECKGVTSSGGTWHAYRANTGGSATASFPTQWAAFTSSANQRIDFSFNGGSANTSGASGQGNFGSTGTLRLGLPGGLSNGGWAGPLPEVIFQGTYNSSDLAAIAADQKTYWGTP